MSRLWRGVVTALAALALASCATVGPRVPAPEAVPAAQAEAAQRQRAEVLAAIPSWSLQGRVAISQGDKGGSGRLDWVQAGDGYRVSLAAPVTRQSWQLIGAADGSVRLEGLEGGTREGFDADFLLREATGWEIPVAALGGWVRGLAAPGDRVAWGEDGRLRRIEADGWTIDYQEWQPAAGGFPEMPRRLQAQRGQARVRLVLDGWQAVP